MLPTQPCTQQETPRKSVLEKLLPYAKSAEQTAALKALLVRLVLLWFDTKPNSHQNTKQDKVAYVERVEKQFMTVLEILQSLPSPLVVPCEELIQVCCWPLLPNNRRTDESLCEDTSSK